MNRKLPLTTCLLALPFLFWNASIPSAHAQSCVAPPANIVAWWPAEGDATDRYGNDNGTIGGGVTFTSGEVGSAFNFDGETGFINLGNPTNLQLQNFTIEAWVQRASSTQSSLSNVIGCFLSYGVGGYAFGLWSDGRLFLSQEGTGHTH